MNFLVENWYVLLAILVVGLCGGVAVYRFAHLPTPAQLEKVKEWLLYAVTEAEKHLGSGTGKLKLRSVYDLFVQRFPWLVRAVSFEMFSDLVDEALDEMRNLLATNKAVNELVNGPEEE